MISSGMLTRRSFFMNSAFLALVSGQIPAITGIRKPSIRPQKSFEQTKIEDRLRDAELRACFYLVLEAADLLVNVGHPRIGGDRHREPGRPNNRISADIEPMIQALHDPRKTDRVNVEDLRSRPGNCRASEDRR